jgi:hypothetical protein
MSSSKLDEKIIKNNKKDKIERRMRREGLDSIIPYEEDETFK